MNIYLKLSTLLRNSQSLHLPAILSPLRERNCNHVFFGYFLAEGY